MPNPAQPSQSPSRPQASRLVGVLIAAVAALPSAALAQSNPLNPLRVDAPPDLPPPPFFDRYVLESPWLVGVVLVALAVVAAYGARGKKWSLPVAGGLAALGAAVIAAGMLVTTPREQVQADARELVAAVAAADAGRTGALLHPDVRMVYFLSGPDGIGRDEILNLVRNELGGRYRVSEAIVREVQVQLLSPASARAQLRVTVTSASGIPNLPFWRIDWRLQGGQWRAVGIQPLAIAGVPDAGQAR